jgi:hypothetical protein
MSQFFELPMFDTDSIQKDQSLFTRGLFCITDLFVNSVYTAVHVKKVRDYVLQNKNKAPLL